MYHRQAIDEGANPLGGHGTWLHREIDFETLRDYPPFQELMRSVVGLIRGAERPALCRGGTERDILFGAVTVQRLRLPRVVRDRLPGQV
jgi:hypothetical protein